MKDLNRIIHIADFRTATPLHERKKETPGEAPGVEGFWLLVEERPFRAA